jgi:hypothetical protein
MIDPPLTGSAIAVNARVPSRWSVKLKSGFNPRKKTKDNKAHTNPRTRYVPTAETSTRIMMFAPTERDGVSIVRPSMV